MNLCKRFISLTVLVLFAFLLWSCLEYHITTQVMPDGRLLRTVIVKGDSTDIFTGSFPVPSDSTWEISTRLESRDKNHVNEGKVFVYEARKEFRNFRDLNEKLQSDSTFAEHIAIHVNLEKRFRGYFTHFYYTETYGRLFPFHSVPVSDYLSDAELQIHQADEKSLFYSREKDSIFLAQDTLNLPELSKEDSARFKALRDTIEQKFVSWQKINIYYDFYHVVTTALKNLGYDADTVRNRESFYSWLDQQQTFETGIENDNAFVNAASAYFNVNPVKLQAANPEGFRSFKKKFRVAAYSLETYTSHVILPGRMVRTNAKKIDANSASWTFKIENFYASDYTMLAESRMVNKWFVITAAVVLMAAIVLVFLRLFKK